MTTFDLNNWDNEEPKSSGSDFFKIPEGKTKLRILTDFVKVQTVWEGVYPNSKPVGAFTGQTLRDDQSVQTKGWCWIETDGELKILQTPVAIIKKLAELKQNPEYAWEEMPMPFDITIANSGEGPNRYSVEPARQNTPVSEEILTKLADSTPIEEVIERIEAKRGEENTTDGIDYPEGDGNIPFGLEDDDKIITRN